MAGPILVDLGGAVVSGINRARYRDVLAEELGFRHETVLSTAATNGEGARTLLVAEFRDDELDEDALGGWWVYVKDGDQAGAQRRVLDQGYGGSESALTLSRPFAAPLATGTTVILTSPLPIKRTLGVKGVDDLVNEAAERSLVEARIPLTGTGTNQQSLAAWPWLVDVGQTTGLYDRRCAIASTFAMAPSGAGYRFGRDGSAITLVTDTVYTTSDVYELGVIVQGNRLIRSGGVWAYGTGLGLLADDDEAIVPESWIRAVGMVKALQHLERVIATNGRLTDAQRSAQMGVLARRKPLYARAAATIALTLFPTPYQPSEDAFADTAWRSTRTLYPTSDRAPY